jgi:hypothetical protein
MAHTSCSSYAHATYQQPKYQHLDINIKIERETRGGRQDETRGQMCMSLRVKTSAVKSVTKARQLVTSLH